MTEKFWDIVFREYAESQKKLDFKGNKISF